MNWRAEAGTGEKHKMKLGILHFNGLGTPKDDAKAFLYFQLAAENGSPEGMYNLGAMYDNGFGTNATANSPPNGLKNPVKLDMKKHARCYKNRAYFMFIRTKG